MKSNIALSMGFLFLLVLLSGQTSAIELRNGTIFNTSESNSSVSFTIPVDADFGTCPYNLNLTRTGVLNITNSMTMNASQIWIQPNSSVGERLRIESGSALRGC